MKKSKPDHVHLYKSASDGRARWSIIERPPRAPTPKWMRTNRRIKGAKDISIYHRCGEAIRDARRAGLRRVLKWDDKWIETYETEKKKYACDHCHAYAPLRVRAAYKLLMKL